MADLIRQLVDRLAEEVQVELAVAKKNLDRVTAERDALQEQIRLCNATKYREQRDAAQTEIDDLREQVETKDRAFALFQADVRKALGVPFVDDGRLTAEVVAEVVAERDRLKGALEQAKQKAAQARAEIHWVNRIGGLGHDKHAALEKALGLLDAALAGSPAAPEGPKTAHPNRTAADLVNCRNPLHSLGCICAAPEAKTPTFLGGWTVEAKTPELCGARDIGISPRVCGLPKGHPGTHVDPAIPNDPPEGRS